ncbi:MAG: hypothetical protein ACP5UO_04955 [Thermoplasmata archaeon]
MESLIKSGTVFVIGIFILSFLVYSGVGNIGALGQSPSFSALPEILDSGIANHTDGQYNNITLNPGGSIYIYGATDGGGQPFSSPSNYTPIFYASNQHIGTNSVEGYSASNSAVSPYGEPISQKAIGGVSIGYPGAVNTSVGYSTKYFQALGEVENSSVSSMNYEFNVTGSEKLAVLFIEGSNYVNPSVNANFQVDKLNILNGPLLFIYLGYSLLNPGSYKIKVSMAEATDNSLACDSILGIYLFPALTFVQQAKQAGYPVTFNENGLPSGSKWGVMIGSSYYFSTNNSLIVNEPNGSYSYRVIPPSGYSPSPSSGSFVISGSPLGIMISFVKSTKGPYKITFSETGLPAGTEWVVQSPNTFIYNSTNSTIVFYEPNGTYFYQVFTYTDYYANLPQGNFTVQGGPVNISVSFSTSVSGTYNVSFYAMGLPSGNSWSVTFNGITKTSTTDYINFTVPNGVYSWSFTLPPPYHATITPEKIAVNNSGADIIIPVLSKTSVSSSGYSLSKMLPIAIIVIVIAIIVISLILIRRRKPSL